MLCAYLPFLVLPLYTAVEKLDWSIAEAAADLGADRVARLPPRDPAAGRARDGRRDHPRLHPGDRPVRGAGPARRRQDGDARQRHPAAVRRVSRDWPFGSAIAFVGMAVVMLGLWLQSRYAAGEAATRGCCEARLAAALARRAAFLYVFLYAPIAVVIVYSFNASRYGGPWRGFTTAVVPGDSCRTPTSSTRRRTPSSWRVVEHGHRHRPRHDARATACRATASRARSSSPS